MDATTGTETDGELVRAMAQGDTSALARAFDRYAATLTRSVWALLDDRLSVEAVVQDSFVTLWQRAATLELPADSMLPWLLVVCRDRAFESGGERVRRPADHEEACERLRWVQDEIAALSETDRRICELCLLEGHSYAEAVEVLGLRVGVDTPRGTRGRRRPKKVVTHDEH